MNAPAVSITRYGTRYWAVWLDGELLAVTVYRKGARAVVTAISTLATQGTEKASHTELE
jgi:hypothetical protein